jgi:hypothetical protein
MQDAFVLVSLFRQDGLSLYQMNFQVDCRDNVELVLCLHSAMSSHV